MRAADDAPITVRGIVTWGGFFATATGAIVSIVWGAANLRAEAHANLEPVKAQTEANTEAVKEIKSRLDATEKQFNELNRKVDVLVAVSERIEKKLDK